MKNLKLILLVSMVALLFSSCGLGKMVSKYPEVSIKLTDQDLENRGGQVAYEIKGTVPAKYMKKKATMTVTPTVEYEGQKITLTPIELQGEKAKASGTRISYKNGGSFTSSGTFEYKNGMEEAEIVVVSDAHLKKKSHTFEPRNIGAGISNTASLMDINPKLSEKAGNGTHLIYGEHGYKPEFLTSTAVLYFDLNKADLNMGLKLNKSAEAKKMISDFQSFMKSGRTIDKIVVTGWASPEGEESLNQGLSDKRAEQGKKWFEKEFDKYLRQYAKANKIKYKDLPKPEIVYDVTSPGEDWDGFEKDLQASSIKEKNQILNVVRSQPNAAQREQKIREMTDIYNEIAEIILPPLRRVEVSMVCNKNNFNDQQIYEMMKTNPDTLSTNEKLYAASMEKDFAKKQELYALIIEKDEGDWRAYNNLGILQVNDYLTNGDEAQLKAGMKNIEKALAISPSNGIVLNNKAVCEFLMGDQEAAMQDFAASEKASVYPVEQDYNLAMNKIKAGDYEGAARAMNNKSCDFNMALTQVLDKKYNEAQKTINCIEDKDAKTYYLAAVLSARIKEEAKVYSNLKEAVKLDPSLKAKAKKDAEFKRYKTKDEFQSIVK